MQSVAESIVRFKSLITQKYLAMTAYGVLYATVSYSVVTIITSQSHPRPRPQLWSPSCYAILSRHYYHPSVFLSLYLCYFVSNAGAKLIVIVVAIIGILYTQETGRHNCFKNLIRNRKRKGIPKGYAQSKNNFRGIPMSQNSYWKSPCLSFMVSFVYSISSCS